MSVNIDTEVTAIRSSAYVDQVAGAIADAIVILRPSLDGGHYVTDITEATKGSDLKTAIIAGINKASQGANVDREMRELEGIPYARDSRKVIISALRKIESYLNASES